MKETIEEIQNLLKYYGFEVEEVFTQKEEIQNYDGTTQQGIEVILHNPKDIREAMHFLVRDMHMGASGTKKGFVMLMNEIHQKKLEETDTSIKDSTVLENMFLTGKITSYTSKVKCFKDCQLDFKRQETTSFLSSENIKIGISVPSDLFKMNKKYNIYVEEI